MENNLKYRHEFKYQCSVAQLEIIKSRVKSFMKPDPHTSNGEYSIRSMYFDNYANRCFFENENGTDLREKYRIRIYNASDQRISLECKRKERSKTYKTSCLITKEQFETIMEGGDFHELLELPVLLRKFIVLIKTQMFHPVVIVEYERTPYVYRDGNVRVTLDRNIRSSATFDCFFSLKLPTRQILPHGQHLLEVKYDEFLPDFIKESLQTDSLQQTTFSKYYLCRKFSNGGLL